MHHSCCINGEIFLLFPDHFKGFFANKKRRAIMILALVVTSLLIFLRAHCLIKRKRKGMCNCLINQHVHVNYKSDTTLTID